MLKNQTYKRGKVSLLPSAFFNLIAIALLNCTPNTALQNHSN